MERISVLHADCREALKTMADNSVDSGVMDPPYALVSIVKRFGKAGAAPAKGNAAYTRASAGFMGQQWDTGETAFDPAFWAEVLRVLKPGAHLVAFSGTRTYHRMACAIEDAGFEIRDQGAWCYGSGFPKSHNQHGEFEGWGTALKPAWEPICIARKPLEGTVAQNLAKWGVGALNIDGCRIGYDPADTNPATNPLYRREAGYANGNAADDGSSSYSLKNGSGERNPSTLGRWPANIIHDGSDEVVALFPESASSASSASSDEPNFKNQVYGRGMGGTVSPENQYGDKGSAARFFYTAKADADDRLGSKHPTVKPVDLMQWLVRLVTPKRVLFCPNCDKLGHGKSAANTSKDQAVRLVSEELQTEGQPPHGALLQQAMCGGGEGAAAEAVRVVRDDIPASQGRGEKVLQSDVCGEMEREESPVINRLCDEQGGVQTALDAGSSTIAQPEGLYLRASLGGATADRPAANESGSGASQKRNQKRQSPGKSGTDAQGRSRQAEPSEAEHPVLSSLSGQDHHKPTCKDCGQVLDWRPGTCLDPFAGTGTTGEAAFREGMRAVLIEREAAYVSDIQRRIELLLAGPDERRRASIKEKIKDGRIKVDGGPLFGGEAA